MPKKLHFLLFAAFCAFFYSCDLDFTLPKKVEIRGNPEIDLPIIDEMKDITKHLTENIRKAFKGDETSDINVLDFISYQDGIQAFLIHYSLNDQPLDFMGSFDVMDDMGNTEEMASKLKDALDKSSGDNDFNNFTGDIDPIEDITLDMSSIFNSVKTNLHTSLSSAAAAIFPIEFLPGEITSSPLGLSGNNFTFGGGFDNITFGSGKLIMELSFDNLSDGGVSVTLNGISIQSESENIPGTVSTGTFPMSSPNDSVTLEFDLTNKTLGNNFIFQINTITIHADSTGNATLNIKPSGTDGNIKIKSIVNLYANQFGGFTPVDLAASNTKILLDFSNSIFVHAKIATGDISLDNITLATDSPINVVGLNPVWDDIRFFQATSNADSDSNTWQGLNTAQGFLSDTSGNNLLGCHLNTKDIEIIGDLDFDNAQPITIYLDNPDSTNVKIHMHPELNIEMFEVLHVDMENYKEKIESELELAPIHLGDVTDYINYIDFDEVGFIITFGQVDIPGIEINIKQIDLGIGTSGNIWQEIKKEDSVTFLGGPQTLNIKSGNTILVEELEIKVDVRFPGNNNVIAIPNFELNGKELKIEVTDIDIKFDWSNVNISPGDMANHEGSFPDTGDDPIDLSEFGSYIDGFSFKGIEAYLFIDCPDALFEFSPNVEMKASYDNDTEHEDFLQGKTLSDAKGSVPEAIRIATEKYNGSLSDLGGLDISNSLNKLLKAAPEDLRFDYNVAAGDAVNISRHTFESLKDNDNLGDLKIDLLLVLPMVLQADNKDEDEKPIDSVIKFDDLLSDSDEDGEFDLLGRSEAGDNSWSEMIQELSLKVKMNLNDSAFTGGTLFIRDIDPNDPDHVLHEIAFPLDGKSLEFQISNEDLKYINGTYPYAPSIGISFPHGTEIIIKRGLSVLGLGIDAKFVVVFDL